MKRQKRNKIERAFSKGYIAGIRGQSINICPYTSLVDARGCWLGGWREGRSQYVYGFVTGEKDY